MKISVQSIGLTPHAPLEEHIEKKLSKLENYYDKIIECKVFLKVETCWHQMSLAFSGCFHLPL